MNFITVRGLCIVICVAARCPHRVAISRCFGVRCVDVDVFLLFADCPLARAGIDSRERWKSNLDIGDIRKIRTVPAQHDIHLIGKHHIKRGPGSGYSYPTSTICSGRI